MSRLANPSDAAKAPSDTASPEQPSHPPCSRAAKDNMKRIPCLALFLVLAPLLMADGPADTSQPANIALAQQVIKAMHADRMFDQMSAPMQQMAAQSINQNSANLTPQQQALAQKMSSQIMALSMDAAKNLITKLDVIYAQVYSEAELKAMKAFFESPEGMSMLQKQPQIMQKLMPYVQTMQRDLGPKIQAIIQDARAEERAQATAAAQTAAPGATPQKPN